MPSSTVCPNPGIAGEDGLQEGEREASDVLPRHLWTEILVRLPLLSLLSVKSVSKAFRYLIKDPKFFHLRLSRFNGVCSESTRSDLLLLERLSDDWKFLLVRGSNAPTEITGCQFPIGGVGGGDNLDVIGYVNGLLCLHSFSFDLGEMPWSCPSIWTCEMILCNPSLGKFEVILPPRPRPADYGPPSFGFGYDPETDDYKAVSIVRVEYECNVCTPWPNNGRLAFTEVYSFREASWKELRDYGIFSGCCLYDWCLEYCVYVNGALHWMAKRAADRDDVSRVISFDLGAESFSYKELPNFDSGDGRVKLLVLFRGLLAVLCISAVDISVWVMRESEWAIECTIGSVSTLYNFLLHVRDGISSAVLCEESNELIVAGCHGIGMRSYNIETQEFKSYNPGVTYVGKYVNSLLWRDSLDPPRNS